MDVSGEVQTSTRQRPYRTYEIINENIDILTAWYSTRRLQYDDLTSRPLYEYS